MQRAKDGGLGYYVSRPSRSMGTALDVTFGTSTAYDALVAREFNLVTAGNAQKWQTIPPSRSVYKFVRGGQMLEFAQAHGMKMRGHSLAWPNQKSLWVLTGQ